jgi:hypothetical protein
MLTKVQLSIIKTDIYYLNIEELKDLCNYLRIPYDIYEQTGVREFKKTGSIDRKEVIIKNILKKLQGSSIKASVIPLKVINKKQLTKITSKTLVHYGQVSSTNKIILKYLKQRTQGKFKFGAIALRIFWDTWKAGKLITYNQYASKWLKETAKHTKPNKEWKYLNDLKDGNVDMKLWKSLRIKKAKKVIKIIKQEYKNTKIQNTNH